MARIDTLSNFLTDVADSIREKTGNTEPIACEDFDTEIESISGGGSANLQTKSVTITENGTTSVTPDTGYDGMSEVRITTNVGGDTPPNYVIDGLVAWFDLDDEIGSDEKWYNKVGNDYIYVKARKFGTSTTNPYRKSKGEPLENYGIFTFASSEDYYKEGYTIEIVATSYGKNSPSGVNAGASGDGHWFVTGNINGTSGIGIRSTRNNGTQAYINVINGETDKNTFSDFLINIGETFGTSVYFSTLMPRTYTSSYKSVVKEAINGSEYAIVTELNASAKSSSHGNELLFLSYYEGNYVGYGNIKCIRVYNRELTEAEKNHNYDIDKNRFNIGE